MDSKVPDASVQGTTQSSIMPRIPPDRGQFFVAPTRFSLRNLLKALSLGLGGFVLVAGLGATVFLSQQNSDNRQHASANYLPPDGMGIYDSCALYSNQCLTNLDTFSQGGFKLVLNYGAWNSSTTLANIAAYAQRAQQDDIKLIWSLKDMWTDKFTTIDTYGELKKESGCTDKICLTKWIVSHVKDFPATWGYYIADEPGPNDVSAVSNLTNTVYSIDTAHPRLIIKLDALYGYNGQNIYNGLWPYVTLAEVLGEDYYPVSYGQNLTSVGPIVNEVQYVVNTATNTYHWTRQGAVVLEVNSGNSSDYCHATAYPSESQMAEMLTLALQNGQPRIVLWYWYPCTSSTQWNNLVTAIKSVTGSGGGGGGGGSSYTECEQGNKNYCNSDGSKTGHYTKVTDYGNGTYGCQDLGYYDCKDQSYSPCQPDGLHKCIAQVPGSSIPTGNIMYQAHEGDTTACGKGATSRRISSDALLYCVCGMDGAPACAPPPTAQPPTPVPPTANPTPSTSPSHTPTTIPSGTPNPTQPPLGSPVPTGTQIVGDINGDGKVDILDYNLLLACYGDKFGTDSCTAGSKADLNGDGVVDGIDYNILLRAMGMGQ